METVLCTLMAATSTLTVLCLRISATTDGSMNVRFASAADDSRNVSEDLVLLDSAGKKEKNAQNIETFEALHWPIPSNAR